MPRTIRVFVVLVALLAAACTNGGEPSPSPTAAGTGTPSLTPTSSPAATAEPSPTAAAPGRPPAECDPVTGGGQTSVDLVDVRVGTHAGYDRIVFEFAPPVAPSPADTLPRYTITGADEIIQDGSGEPVAVDGAALYSVVLQGASGVDLSGDQPVQTYTGPREFKRDFPVLVELQHAGDFEDVLSWGIGLKAPRCIEATRMTSPLRLVLDIPHS